MNSPSPAQPHIPITVFTGFLGSGKTTIILSLLASLPSDYKVALLKNEFGDIKIDSQLFLNATSNSSTMINDSDPKSLDTCSKGKLEVMEFINGCVCCNLTGQIKNGLLEMRGKGGLSLGLESRVDGIIFRGVELE